MHVYVRIGCEAELKGNRMYTTSVWLFSSAHTHVSALVQDIARADDTVVWRAHTQSFLKLVGDQRENLDKKG